MTTIKSKKKPFEYAAILIIPVETTLWFCKKFVTEQRGKKANYI